MSFGNGEFIFKDLPYRGELEIIPDKKSGKYIFVNKLPMEDYLLGVVAAEMPSGWHLEALKSQAVAARTYAVDSILTSPIVYHVESTTQSQVYGGIKEKLFVRTKQ